MSTNANILDRRSSPRLALTAAIRYGTNDELSTGELTDVSAGGIGITGEKTYPIGTELQLRFRSRTSKSDLLTLRAVVRHHQGKRMGLEFINVPMTDFHRTLNMIERLTSSQAAKDAVAV